MLKDLKKEVIATRKTELQLNLEEKVIQSTKVQFHKAKYGCTQTKIFKRTKLELIKNATKHKGMDSTVQLK